MAGRDYEFCARYPSKYGLKDKFHTGARLSPDHQKYVKNDFFPVVGNVTRYPRYKNQRGVDPQVKIFLDQEKESEGLGWNLPVPNQDAAYKSLGKYGKTTVIMKPQDVDDLNLGWEWMKRQFHPYMCNARVSTVQEEIDHMDHSSGSGFPFNEEFPKKRDLFEKDPEINQWLENDWEVLANDPRYTMVFSNSLKEELRPDQKILENSQRTFLAGAVDATCHGGRLFRDMNEKMYDSHLKTASAIGMTPLKGQWDQLYRKLNVFPNGYALDESQYDSSLRDFLMWGCARYRWSCLRPEDRTPENLRRIKTYYRNLINTLILTPEGVLVLKTLGNPSGSVNTVTDNTLILYWIMAYAWIKLAPPEYKHYEMFEQHTAKALLGDDNTWTVSDNAHPFYNAVNVIEVWKTIGITTTTDSLEARPAMDLDFLSAHTVFVNGLAVPLYDRNKLMQSLLFAKKKNMTPETSLTRVCGLLLVGWSDLTFRGFCRDFIGFLLDEYDNVLKDDIRWISAKCQIVPDDAIWSLWSGQNKLKPQFVNYQELEEIKCQPDKVDRMSANKKQGSKKRGSRKPRGAKRPQKVAHKQVRQPKMRNARVRRGGRGLRGPIGPARQGALTAYGKTSFGSAQGVKSCVITENEFIGAITSGASGPPTTFNNQSFAINPGQATLFPWLALQAKQWEFYEFLKLVFYYKREVSEFATAGTTGKVIMQVDYDASDSPPTTKQQMEDTQPHVDCMPCQDMTLVVNHKGMHPAGKKYVRPGGLPGASDIKTYDAGILNVATQAIASSAAELGELRVAYTVRFSSPILEATNSAPANNQVAVFTEVAGVALTTATSSPLVLAGALGGYVFNGLAVPMPNGSVIPPPGNYRLDYTVGFVMTGNVTEFQSHINKNGALYPNNAQLDQIYDLPSAAYPNWTTSDSVFITANGTDAFAVNARATFSTGTGTAYGKVMLTAI